MKKILSLLILILLVVTSCSEPKEFELPYELSPTATVGSETTVTAANAVCPAPTASFTVDSESSVFYVIQLSSAEALTSDEVFDEENELVFSEAGTKSIELAGLEFGEAYTIYSVTVNVNGTRSEEVTTTSFVMPTFSEVVTPTLGVQYTGTAFYNGSAVSVFDATLTENGEFVFDSNALWGDWVAWLYDYPAYEGMFQYPGTITLNEDFTVDISSEEFYAMGGSGTYDPCTGIFSLALDTNLLDDDETEEIESFTVPVELVPAE